VQLAETRDDDARRNLEALCLDPVENWQAAHWFASLPQPMRRAHAERTGVLLLTSETDFAFGCGASVSPYRWVLVVSTAGLELMENNEFKLALRDDRHVRATSGPYWTWQQSYDRTAAAQGPLFAKRSPGKGQTGGDLWLPSTSWRYVGPVLEPMNEPLRATDVNRGP